MNDLKAGRRGEWRTSRDKGCVRERDGERRVRGRTEGYSATCLRAPGELNTVMLACGWKGNEMDWYDLRTGEKMRGREAAGGVLYQQCTQISVGA